MADSELDILKEIRDLQENLLAHKREEFEFIKKHYDRAEAIQDKAEKMQDRMISTLKVIMPVVIICIILLVVMIGKNFF